jgi:FkbM family methyltransferase
MKITGAKNLIVRTLRAESALYRWLKAAYNMLPESLRREERREVHQEQPVIRGLLDAFSRAARDDGVTFVQIGAGDGVRGDPIHPFVVRDDWSGILVEPVRRVFDRLVANYEGRDNLIFENVAVSTAEGYRDFWYLRETDDDVPSWYDQLGSFAPEVILKHACSIPGIEGYLAKEQVACTTLAALLDRHGVDRLDVLHVDTEGHDYEVIKQLDLDAFSPAIILYEHIHLSEDEAQACARHLASRGYRLQRDGTDTIAYLEARVPERRQKGFQAATL